MIRPQLLLLHGNDTPVGGLGLRVPRLVEQRLGMKVDERGKGRMVLAGELLDGGKPARQERLGFLVALLVHAARGEQQHGGGGAGACQSVRLLADGKGPFAGGCGVAVALGAQLRLAGRQEGVGDARMGGPECCFAQRHDAAPRVGRLRMALLLVVDRRLHEERRRKSLRVGCRALLADGDGAAGERLGLPVAALHHHGGCEPHEQRPHVGMLPAEGLLLDDQRPPHGGFRLGVAVLRVLGAAEVDEGSRHLDAVAPEEPLAHGDEACPCAGGLRMLAALAVGRGQRDKARGDVAVVCPERLLAMHERLLKKRLGVRVALLAHERGAKIVGDVAELHVVGLGIFLGQCQRPFEQRHRLVGAALLRHHQREADQRHGNVPMLAAEVFFLQRHNPLEMRLGVLEAPELPIGFGEVRLGEQIVAVFGAVEDRRARLELLGFDEGAGMVAGVGEGAIFVVAVEHLRFAGRRKRRRPRPVPCEGACRRKDKHRRREPDSPTGSRRF